VHGAYLLSTFLRFVLDEDVYPRLRITPGQSYAASSLLHYVLMAVRGVIGLGVLGMDMSRVTVLVSAFGVGIGFGMQSVVHNFVSGLILGVSPK
jgi:small-conductance mechanosensitive channel